MSSPGAVDGVCGYTMYFYRRASSSRDRPLQGYDFPRFKIYSDPFLLSFRSLLSIVDYPSFDPSAFEYIL